MIAAVVRSLRDNGYPHWTPVLVISSAVVGIGLLLLLRRPLSGVATREHDQVRVAAPPDTPGGQAAFPTPPLPGRGLAAATKEGSHG